MNKYEERGHPYLKPLSGCIKPFGTLLIITKNEVVVMQFIIILTHLSKNTSLVFACFKNCHSTMSCPLLMSGFSATKLFLFPLLYQIL